MKRNLITTNCNRQCTLWPGKITKAASEQVEIWIQDGMPVDEIAEKMMGNFDVKVAGRNIYRHISKHMTEPDEEQEVSSMTDLQVLERMIKVGARNLKGEVKVRITPEMTIRAIELKYKLTQGNVFEDFLHSMGTLMESEVGRGDDPAAQDADEASQAVEE